MTMSRNGRVITNGAATVARDFLILNTMIPVNGKRAKQIILSLTATWQTEN